MSVCIEWSDITRTDREVNETLVCVVPHTHLSSPYPVFGPPFVKRFALCYRTVVCHVCNVGVLSPNDWMDQDETWHGGRPRPGHIGTLCYMGTQLPPKGGGAQPQFSAHACCGQTAGWIKMPLGTMSISMSIQISIAP